MDAQHLENMPLPKPISLLLVAGTGFFTYLHKLNHDDITFYLSSVTAICAILSYGIRFVKWANGILRMAERIKKYKSKNQRR